MMFFPSVRHGTQSPSATTLISYHPLELLCPPPLLPRLPILNNHTYNLHHLITPTMTKKTLHSHSRRMRKRRMRKRNTWSIGNQMTRPTLAIGRSPTRVG